MPVQMQRKKQPMPTHDKEKRDLRCVFRFPPLRLIFVAIFAALCLVPVLTNADRYFNTNNPGEPPTRLPPRSDLPIQSSWKFQDVPSFCRTLVSNPVKLVTCQRNKETQACPNGTISMMSQFFQDYYLYTRHFSKLPRRGIYVDVAANHYTHLSNTHFFDTCLGWSGVCVEAAPHYIEGLKVNRTCHVVPTCVGDTYGQKVSFILGGGSGGIADTNKNLEAWQKEGRNFNRVNLTCTTLAHEFENMRVTHVDYLSLDVEGHELMVLKGIDWDKVVIGVLTIEVSRKSLPEIEEFLSTKSYTRHIPDLDERTLRTGILYYDAVFVHSSVKFGEPK